MDNYLAAVDARQGVKVIINNESVWITRRRLLAHLQLSEIEIKIKSTRQPVEISAYIIEYLSLAGLTDYQIKEASTYEILEAFFAFRQLNTWQWLLPWLKTLETPSINPAAPPEAYEYAGRRWAVWVHQLASRYGWPPETIWNLYPEEAAAYIQEIMLSEYWEREDQRALSEVSYKYDQITKTSKFIPAPMYSWMVDESIPDVIRTPVKALPVGNVIRMED
jgi:hypothetical protein